MSLGMTGYTDLFARNDSYTDLTARNDRVCVLLFCTAMFDSLTDYTTGGVKNQQSILPKIYSASKQADSFVELSAKTAKPFSVLPTKTRSLSFMTAS